MRDCAGRPTWCSDCTVPSICRFPGSSNHRIRFAAHAPQGALSSTDEPLGKPRGGKGRYFHHSSNVGKGSRTARAMEVFTPAQSSPAQSAREIRPCLQTAKDAI